MTTSVHDVSEQVQHHAEVVTKIVGEIERAVVGQTPMIERLLIGLLTGGHVLLEGVPGLAKTLTVSSLAQALHGEFSRIQFTPDLLPADLVGTLIYNPQEGSFKPRKGPVFTNILLADEINRAPAKVQSALLEAMQERQVTIGDTTYPLDDPFLVLATQNPIEQEGTYQLPEAQVDRFMLKLSVDYPSKQEEREIVDLMTASRAGEGVRPVVDLDEIRTARGIVAQIAVDEKVKDYAVDLVHATRRPAEFGLELAHLIEFGASPRATINLILAAKGHAFLRGRGYVTPTDVKAIGMDVMRHRIITTYQAQAEDIAPEEIVRRLFDHVPVP